MTKNSAPDFEGFRAGFPALRERTYLSISDKMILHDRVRASVDLYLDRLAAASASRVDHELTVEEARRGFARLVNVPSETVAVTRNVSDGVNSIAWAMPFREGDNIVLTASSEHPNNLYPWLRQQKRGIELRIVPEGPGGSIDIAAMIAAMDDRTALLTCPSASFAPGFRTDLARLGEACRARGVFFMVDGVQTAGILQHDLAQEMVDGFAVSTSKGLLGGYGFGFLYISGDWIDRLEPAYLSRPSVFQETEDHSSMGDHDYTLQPDSRRFEVGSYNLAGAYAAATSLQLLYELGPPAVEARALDLADELRDGLSGTGFGPLVSRCGDEKTRSHIVTIGALDHGGHEYSDDPSVMALSQRLKEENVSHAIRRGQIRMALHAFNAPEDVEKVISVVAGMDTKSGARRNATALLSEG